MSKTNSSHKSPSRVRLELPNNKKVIIDCPLDIKNVSDFISYIGNKKIVKELQKNNNDTNKGVIVNQ